jgi:hypothetical protein
MYVYSTRTKKVHRYEVREMRDRESEREREREKERDDPKYDFCVFKTLIDLFAFQYDLVGQSCKSKLCEQIVNYTYLS